jgi:hypothetical protein
MFSVWLGVLAMTPEQEQALLDWLKEVDSRQISTGLLAKAFQAGWEARETARGARKHAGGRDEIREEGELCSVCGSACWPG